MEVQTEVVVENVALTNETTPAGAVLAPAEKKSPAERREKMNAGNVALLQVLSDLPTKALTKKEIFASLSPEARLSVEDNWNIRITYLEESGVLESTGNKIAKKYWRVA